MTIRISAIAAMGKNRAIGKDNQLLWHIPEEFKHFKATTTGKPVIMGRKTYESLGRPLPNRANIVVSRTPDKVEGNVFAVATLDQAIAHATLVALDDGRDEIFIIGGAQLYADSLPLLDRIYLTVIDQDYEADTFFPAFEGPSWTETARTKHPGPPPYTIKIFDHC